MLFGTVALFRNFTGIVHRWLFCAQRRHNALMNFLPISCGQVVATLSYQVLIIEVDAVVVDHRCICL